MTHELNKRRLKKAGWAKDRGGWVPKELVGTDHTPIGMEIALLITNHMEEEEQRKNK